MEKSKTVSFLEKVGLSNYEARAYLAALNHPPLNGYKLSQLSGVPRSRIYETIEKLISKGLLVSQAGEKNIITPLDFNTFLDKIESQNIETINYLREKLPVVSKQENEGIWNITGREHILQAVSDMISNAEQYIYLEMFCTDLLYVKTAVENCQKKDIPVWGIYCGEGDVQIKNIFPHLGASCCSCNEIAVCVDGENALIGFTAPVESASAALTRNKGFIYITEQYIKHEAFLNNLYSEKNKEAIGTYIKKYREFMDQFPKTEKK